MERVNGVPERRGSRVRSAEVVQCTGSRCPQAAADLNSLLLLINLFCPLFSLTSSAVSKSHSAQGQCIIYWSFLWVDLSINPPWVKLHTVLIE